MPSMWLILWNLCMKRENKLNAFMAFHSFLGLKVRIIAKESKEFIK